MSTIERAKIVSEKARVGLIGQTEFIESYLELAAEITELVGAVEQFGMSLPERTSPKGLRVIAALKKFDTSITAPTGAQPKAPNENENRI